ncbi:MAG: hypothetical protein DI598_05360 [Pseudopedobacter saltans]|uniref:Alkaline phosphatase n=1 Tax=Pseudopedobacter saltans TaxID=151895 RepID=A0A2W5F535_9SPHI|nr:MAG: hypothetical protein DI598_05360 [Pseudopedobacter saltans]
MVVFIKMIRFQVIVVILCTLLAFENGFGQRRHYSLSNVHSHNDYKQSNPFWNAYSHGLGSIEADTYLKNGKILIGHNVEDLVDSVTLQKLYLDPLNAQLKINSGYPYQNHSKPVLLMIEMKTLGNQEIVPLVALLNLYPEIFHGKRTSVIITGNLPSDSLMEKLPNYVLFDGQIRYVYSPKVLLHIGMLSDDLHHYVKWDGSQNISDKDFNILKDLVDKVHKIGKKVRFWNAPDNVLAWETFIKLGVDYINTDHIETISSFFSTISKK